MSWFSRNARTLRIVAGLAAGTGTVAIVAASDRLKSRKSGEDFQVPVTEQREPFFSSQLPVNKVLASYTNNAEPSVKWDHNWDRRDPKSLVKEPKDDSKKEDYENELKKKKPTATRHLFLIRHGQYNLDGKEDSDRYLTKLGREQAELTGRRLKELGHPYTVLVNSTMTRAAETADIIAAQLGTDVTRRSCDLLREGAPIPPEPPVGHWRPEVSDFFQEGAAIEAAFRQYVHRASPEQKHDSYEVLTCHGNVIRYFVCRALQFPPEAWLRLGLYHGSITHVIIRPTGRVAMRTFSDAGYMPADKVTSV